MCVHVAVCIEFYLEWIDGTHSCCTHVSMGTRDCLDNTSLGIPNVQEHVFRHWPHLIEVRPQRGQLISDLWSFRHPPACYLLTGINWQCVTFTKSHIMRVSPSKTHLPFITVKLHPSHICIIHVVLTLAFHKPQLRSSGPSNPHRLRQKKLYPSLPGIYKLSTSLVPFLGGHLEDKMSPLTLDSICKYWDTTPVYSDWTVLQPALP